MIINIYLKNTVFSNYRPNPTFSTFFYIFLTILFLYFSIYFKFKNLHIIVLLLIKFSSYKRYFIILPLLLQRIWKNFVLLKLNWRIFKTRHNIAWPFTNLFWYIWKLYIQLDNKIFKDICLFIWNCQNHYFFLLPFNYLLEYLFFNNYHNIILMLKKYLALNFSKLSISSYMQ